MAQFICARTLMRRPNVYFIASIRSGLNKDTLYKWFAYVRKLAPILQSFGKSALMINSGIWDIAAVNDGQESYEDHLHALHHLIFYIKHHLPEVDLIWKSTTALHIHRGPDCERLGYVSDSRVKLLHEEQMKIMKEMDVSVLDLF